MNLHTINFKSIGSDNLVIQGYASVFNNADYHNDVIIQGAFLKSIEKHSQGLKVKLLWQHDHTKPIGVVNILQEDSHGLFVEASINSFVSQGSEVIALIKQQAVDSFSIGFNIEKSAINKSGQREVTEINLWEVSVVTFPANYKAKIQNFNSYLYNCNKVSNALSTISKSIFNF